MIEIKNLTFAYRKNEKIFTDLNLTLREGGIYGLLGSNGVGKSTLLYLMCGLLTPKSGCVTMDGVDVRRRLPSVLSETFIVPEEFELPSVTMKEYCHLNSPFYPNFSFDDLVNNLSMFGMKPTDNISDLSMGQRKKAYLCFALACNTRLLVMDEPTNGLDISSKGEFRRFIASHTDENRIIIISTHQVHDIERLLDHVLILDRGGMVVDMSMWELSRRLSFESVPMGIDPGDVLFSTPVVGGSGTISRMTEGMDESEINLETLYAFATREPERLRKLLSE